MLKVLFLTLGLLLVAGQAQACIMSAQQKQALFVNFDRNRDGRVDMFEYLSGETNRFGQQSVDMQALEQRFHGMDRLKRGWVPPDSFVPINPQKCMKEAQMAY